MLLETLIPVCVCLASVVGQGPPGVPPRTGQPPAGQNQQFQQGQQQQFQQGQQQNQQQFQQQQQQQPPQQQQQQQGGHGHGHGRGDKLQFASEIHNVE